MCREMSCRACAPKIGVDESARQGLCPGHTAELYVELSRWRLRAGVRKQEDERYHDRWLESDR